MRYAKDHRENTNKKIIDIASRRFRKDGIQAVGIAGLMSDAGLTHGGFYSHFKSKEDLVVKSVTQALEETLLFLESHVQEHEGNIEKLLQAYLHPVHRDAPENGCAIAAIGPELGRRPQESKEVINRKIEAFFDLIEQYLPSGIAEEKKHKVAVSIFTLMVGALQVSRMMADQERRDEILKNGIHAALTLAGAE